MMRMLVIHRCARVSILGGLLQAGCVPDADSVVAGGGGSSAGGTAPDSSSSSTAADAPDGTTSGPTTADSTSAGSTNEGPPAESSSSEDGGSSTGDAPPSSPFVDACVDEVNVFRAMEGLSLLTRWTEGEACAMEAAVADAAVGDMGDPFGSIPRGSRSLCGESHPQYCGTAPGSWKDPVEEIAACAERYFSEGPQGGNYQNMMDPANSQVACGWAESSGGWFFAYHLFF